MYFSLLLRLCRQQPTAGWHLTYMMPPHEIQRKLRSFTHAECVPPYIPLTRAPRVSPRTCAPYSRGDPLAHAPSAHWH
jgi:hypothetical protein